MKRHERRSRVEAGAHVACGRDERIPEVVVSPPALSALTLREEKEFAIDDFANLRTLIGEAIILVNARERLHQIGVRPRVVERSASGASGRRRCQKIMQALPKRRICLRVGSTWFLQSQNTQGACRLAECAVRR